MLIKNLVLVFTLLLAACISAVALAITTQTNPPILRPNCGTGPTPLTANITGVAPASSGTILFSCGTSGDAITVVSPGAVIPQFTLPPGYTSLKISTSPACASAISLLPGSSLSFGTGAGTLPVASYNYCASFSSTPASGLQTFTVTWTQSAPSTSSIECGHETSCSVQSNATLSNIRFAGNTIHVEAEGPHGAHGYANVTVPKSAVPHIGTLHVFVDNSKLGSSAVTITSNSTDYFIYFTFTFHSPVLIDIQLTAPENTATPTILGLDPTLSYGMVGTLVAVIIVVSAALVVRRRRGTSRTITRDSKHPGLVAPARLLSANLPL